MKPLLILLLLAGVAGAGEIRGTPYMVHLCDDKAGVDMKSVSIGDPAVKELLAAAEGVLPCISASDDMITNDLMLRTTAMGLREAADRIDRCDAAIRRFRDAVRKVKR